VMRLWLHASATSRRSPGPSAPAASTLRPCTNSGRRPPDCLWCARVCVCV
jgi:hypothetical protein